MKNKKILIMVAVILLIGVIGVVGFTFARYQSTATSTPAPKVAKWQVKVGGVDISDGTTKSFTAKIKWEDNPNISGNGQTVIAPGSKGEVSFDIDATGSQVAVKYQIKLDTSELTNHKQIKITKITATQNEEVTTINETEEFNGTIKLEEVNNPVTIKIYIEWDPLINNENDTEMGLNALPLNIGVSVTASQKINDTLAETIINNAKNPKYEDSTIYSETPKTKPAQEISKEDERTLSLTADDYGNSYYFRGNVTDNYLNFNEMCWRIVRIEGDGSIKLILEDKTQSCETATGGENTRIDFASFGYTGDGTEENPYKANFLNGKQTSPWNSTYKIITDWFNTNFDSENILNKIKIDTWNLGDNETKYDTTTGLLTSSTTPYYYESKVRLEIKKTPTLKSNLKYTFKSNIGLLTADEVVFAGGLTNTQNTAFYLCNTTFEYAYWLLTVSSFGYGCYNNNCSYKDYAYYFNVNGGRLSSNNGLGIIDTYSVVPSIVLNPNIELISGDGTKENPYRV